MTNKEAIELLMVAYESAVIKGGRGCGKVTFRTAILMGANALKVLDQYRFERDVAIEQLNELGLELGQKIEGVYLSKEEHEKLLEYQAMYENLRR